MTTTPATRAELVEVMATCIWHELPHGVSAYCLAEAILAAIEAHYLVVVPSRPTQNMVNTYREARANWMNSVETIIGATVLASPYRKEQVG